MELVVLGTATPYPRPDQACSGYLLRAAGTTVWVDAGPGTLANLQRHLRPDQLSAVWLSHTHADHTADLLTAYYALAFADLSPAAPIPVFGPPGWAERMEAFLASGQPNPMKRVFEVHELHDGHEVDLAGLRLTSRAVEHGLPAFGLRAEHGGRSLAYSGDTGPCAALEDLARGVDLLLCEADSSTWPAGEPRWHCTPEDAGETARRAGAGRLVVTHVGPSLTPGEATRRAEVAFGGRTHCAREGDVYSLLSA
ncbi:MBL fold metallo-hydrolase [Streptoalloteichus hindustanus]|uniref:Ribonuclease BN, tRNA processing enzyme n=1 Tax=Streptoalloteichus hindustanus TaxID=2017 RepID=A0A1M4Y2F6_STRHI|nr:MBL fold metallo-hydrolase [Streptoalloteichus hindustanus]SHF00014.1 Ribonuclease BN, tRNA processing enzyme [Streptoalloteichus hindustanus]